MKKIFIALFAVLSMFQAGVKADEGMWLLSLLGNMNMEEMTEMGLQLSADQIYSINHASLKDAVGALDMGSCTAELVSPDGLLLTNHHCGYDEIQYHSTLEKDYLKNGFWAMTRAEELPNKGKTISFMVRMEEVTDRFTNEINEEMDPHARSARIRSLSAAIESEATRNNEYEAYVSSLYNDNRFFLFVMETYRDVRLVGAPPEAIGKYGGDTDNWVWPRHTGDFSMFRVYTAPDGKPADYSPDNVPMKSKSYLPISLKGYEKNDFAMVMGFPGSTDRYLTSWEIDELLQITHPNRIRIRGIKQDLQMEDMRADEKVRLQYAAKFANSANYWKYSIGQAEGLKNLNVLEKKQNLEAQFTEWVNLDEARIKLYGNVLSEIRTSVAERKELQNAAQYLYETISRGGGMESVYFSRHLDALQSALENAKERPQYLEEILEAVRMEAAAFYKDYNPPTDKKVMAEMIRLLIEELDDAYLPVNIIQVKEKYKGNIERYVDHYFKKSFVVDEDKFNAFIDDPSLKVLQKDPAFMAYLASRKIIEVNGNLSDYLRRSEEVSRLYLKGLMEMQPGKDFYSDANSTMRLTYGTVGDYIPRDAVHYAHYTTMEGIMEKEDPGSYEFIVPEKLKELYKKKDYVPYGSDGTLYICFTTNNDITGGNSGSPVINSHGELIGLAFDGNWEAMSGDIAFEPEIQKCINVDIRYVLFIIDKLAGAGHLVEEMTLVR
ncbi:MAG: S46 family peptidase [Bacteroidales bacterium]